LPDALLDYLNSIEILNRQSLPLRSNYNRRFKNILIKINFNYENEFNLENEDAIASWLSASILSEGKKEGEINYIFCDDEYLHKINLEYLKHDDLTDIISFDYTLGNEIHGDISVERVQENAADFKVPLKRKYEE
jgi:ssRNA-specific RNase YbeY (16S rRNA maturation enzyme)